MIPSVQAGDFVLNFMPESTAPGNFDCTQVQADCTVINGNLVDGGFKDGNDGTRFIQEKLYRASDYYFHVVIGDPATGFANEYYVVANNSVSARINTQSVQNRASSSFSGGNEQFTNVLPDVSTESGMNSVGKMFGNAKDPFGVTVDPAVGNPYDLSGNGTQDPTKVVFRMVLSGAGISMEVVKPILDRKPLISQFTNDGVMSAEFVVDLRGISYNEMDRAAPILNRLSLNDPTLPVAGMGDFDMAQAQKPIVTAGQFVYTPGQGWLKPKLRFDTTLGQWVNDLDADGNIQWIANPEGWDIADSRYDEGSYTYADGTGFDVYGVNWGSFFDYNQNRTACSSGNRVKAVCP